MEGQWQWALKFTVPCSMWSTQTTFLLRSPGPLYDPRINVCPSQGHHSRTSTQTLLHYTHGSSPSQNHSCSHSPEWTQAMCDPNPWDHLVLIVHCSYGTTGWYTSHVRRQLVQIPISSGCWNHINATENLLETSNVQEVVFKRIIII